MDSRFAPGSGYERSAVTQESIRLLVFDLTES